MAPFKTAKLLGPGFFLGFVVVTLIGIAAYRQNEQNTSSGQWARHTIAAVNQALPEVPSKMKDVGTRARAYLVTWWDCCLKRAYRAKVQAEQKTQTPPTTLAHASLWPGSSGREVGS